MFAVIFEVQPGAGQWEAYLEQARLLRPELECIAGFVENLRYRSLTREGLILSLSCWRDEKADVRWRTQARHHEAQERGRGGILADYHLRVGEITQDTHLPAGHSLRQQRLDETEVGGGTTVSLTTASIEPQRVPTAAPAALATQLGLAPTAAGLVAWDLFEAVLSPGDLILLRTWRDAAAGDAGTRDAAAEVAARTRCVRVVRDYGMFDRREAPQFYPGLGERPH
jgi:heme-degrading monooxygenase HmoA